MSDLAPFVAATLRDKVVSELQEEVLLLQTKLKEQQTASQQVTITGPMGSPIYAQADFRKQGKFDVSPELWKVEFIPNYYYNSNSNQDHNDESSEESNTTDKSNQSSSLSSTHHHQPYCTLAELSEMEVRVGGILKAKWSRDARDDSIEGFVNDIDNNYYYSNNNNNLPQGGTLSIWFGAAAGGIWLTIFLVGIEKQAYAQLRDLDLSGGRNLWSILLLQYGNNTSQSSSQEARIEFREVSFMISHMNHAMEAWGMPTEPPEEEEEI